MNLEMMAKTAEKLIIDNSPTILTGVGIVGTVATAYLSHQAALNSRFVMARLDQQKARKEALEGEGDGLPVSTKDVFKATWQLYVPPVAVGALTVSSIFMANKINLQRAAALAAAYTISQDKHKEYRDKVLEKIGVKREEEARAEIAQTRINEHPPSKEGQILIIDGTDVLVLDQFTGRYFKSSMEKLKKSENIINNRINQHGYASLGDFYEEVGLPSVSMSEEVGWDSGEMLELLITSALSPQGVPCISIDFNVKPIRRPYGHVRAM